MAEKEEEGQEHWLLRKAKEVKLFYQKKYVLNGYIVQRSNTGRKTDLKSNISRYSAT